MKGKMMGNELERFGKCKVIGDCVFFSSGPFSQWYKRDFEQVIPCGFFEDPVTFNCCEQAMMWNKAFIFGDLAILGDIMSTNNPRKQKILGRRVKGFVSSKWDELKFSVVHGNNLDKFVQHDDLKRLLLSTGEKTIAEASPWDSIWGIGMSVDNPDILDISKWGQNLLGEALMQVRKDIHTIEEAFGDLSKIDPEERIDTASLLFDANKKLNNICPKCGGMSIKHNDYRGCSPDGGIEGDHCLDCDHWFNTKEVYTEQNERKMRMDKEKRARCPVCGLYTTRHWSQAEGGNLPSGRWDCYECIKCKKYFNVKPCDEVDLLDYGPFHDERGNPIGR